eukprot:9294789-Pyramimonas_sp.AAC.1
MVAQQRTVQDARQELGALFSREDDWQKASSDLSFVDDLRVILQVDRTDEPPRKSLCLAEVAH